jgi:hypothetical protein
MILNELERDIIVQSTPREIVRRLADKFVDDYGDNIIADIKIDQDELKKLVMGKLADRIIDAWRDAEN